MDLGPCPKLHSDKLKNEYEKARHSRSYGYEEEFEQALQQFVSECDHRINNARRRLEKQSSDSNAGPLVGARGWPHITWPTLAMLTPLACWLDERTGRSW